MASEAAEGRSKVEGQTRVMWREESIESAQERIAPEAGGGW